MAGEDKIWQALARRYPGGKGLLVGIGDDGAVVRPSPRKDWVLTTDQLVEGSHFHLLSHPARALGWKALARCLSDAAAMGANPRYALVSVALPPRLRSAWLGEFHAGFAALARRYGVRLIGGDLSSARTVAVDVHLIAEVSRGRALLRSGARPGDILYVTGRVGESAYGRAVFENNLRGPGIAAARRRHLYPEPRVEVGRGLAALRVSAAMDLSDGLSTDLARLCRASGAGAEITLESLPAVSVPSRLQKRLKLTPQELALHGGEDYELLFTAGPRARIPSWIAGVRVSPIGRITKHRGIWLTQATSKKKVRLRPRGWDHFRSS